MVTMLFLVHNSGNVEGRYHNHKQKQKPKKSPPAAHHPPFHSSPSPKPVKPPASPSVPSNPHPNDPGSSTSGTIFDVTSFGAVGDGSADDTAAFRAAWKAACAVESGVVLAPENHSFKITSTIFSGPCKPGLVFQVSIR